MKFQVAVLLSSLVFTGTALAQAKAPEPDFTLSYNVGLVSEYRYRGISQSKLRPAVQAGVDFAHKSGFYLGAWGSSIRWIKDAGGGADTEIDVYGGYKFEAGPVAWDVGVLTYNYPGHNLGVSPNTQEIYGAGTMGPVTVKYSHAVSNLFGFANSKNSFYLEGAATFDLGNGWSIVPHIGYQKVQKFSAGSYTDYSVAVNKDFGNGFVASATAIGTDSDKAVYLTPSGKHTGKAAIVLGLKVNF